MSSSSSSSRCGVRDRFLFSPVERSIPEDNDLDPEGAPLVAFPTSPYRAYFTEEKQIAGLKALTMYLGLTHLGRTRGRFSRIESRRPDHRFVDEGSAVVERTPSGRLGCQKFGEVVSAGGDED